MIMCSEQYSLVDKMASFFPMNIFNYMVLCAWYLVDIPLRLLIAKLFCAFSH
uniref:Uncharacterized protein n=1 Tax=Arundo donax TaxID=35708 RepID=A0A0A9HS99_ARUDO